MFLHVGTVALGIGSSMGLAARALVAHPSFPTYPEGLSLAEIGAYVTTNAGGL